MLCFIVKGDSKSREKDGSKDEDEDDEEDDKAAALLGGYSAVLKSSADRAKVCLCFIIDNLEDH